jgi:phage/plasmid-associated DNA primase
MIPFEVQIPEKERNSNLHNEIIEEEMSGVLNWAVEGLIRLTKNKGQFTQSAILDQVTEEYREETDQVYSYIKECFGQYETAVNEDAVRRVHDVALIYSEKAVMSTKYIYMHYQLWAKENGVYEMKQQNFTSKLAEKLKTKSIDKRVKILNVTKGYAAGEPMVQSYESKVVKCIVGFRINGDIKISVNGLNVSMMETILQGAE